MNQRYPEKRSKIEQFFVPENKKADTDKVDYSPSGNFKIEIHRYATTPKTWDYSRGIVSRVADGIVVADVKRNYGHFWHTWIAHLNGNEYLLCGEDYQGYSCVNLTSGQYHVYFPEAGYQGVGFCWAAVYPSPDKLTLAVDGCYWACPYELVLFDFRDPDTLPYPELARYDSLDKCSGWIDNDTFVITRELEIRKSDGALYDSLSEQEQEILDRDSSLIGYRKETFECKRPNNFNAQAN